MSLDHYERLLADVYDWMHGDWETTTEQAREQFVALDLPPAPPGSRAIDVGAGTGYQSIPLAELGYVVTSIDPSPAMLARLEPHIGDLAIETTTALIESYQGPSVNLICCMGDTLAHLPSLAHVFEFLRDCHRSLAPAGRLILSYRDGSAELAGDDRFVPIQSDDRRIFTCFVETLDSEHTRIHDIMHIRTGPNFRQHVSSYVKLRLRSSVVDQSLAEAGFGAISTTIDGGIVTTVAVAGTGSDPGVPAP